MIDIAHVEELIVSNPTDAANNLRHASVEEVNNISNLTPEQKAKINGINDTYRGMLKSHSEANAYRWQNYYDCVDDYSVCGLMDKAEAWAEAKMLERNAVMIEEVLRGGYFIHTSECMQLLNIETGEVIRGGAYGHYGAYFTVAPGVYIGKSKKVSTYIKKGYIPEYGVRTYKCVFDHQSRNGNIMCSSVELLDEKVTTFEKSLPEEYVRIERDFIDYYYGA